MNACLDHLENRGIFRKKFYLEMINMNTKKKKVYSVERPWELCIWLCLFTLFCQIVFRHFLNLHVC